MRRLFENILANNKKSDKISITDFTAYTDKELIEIFNSGTDDKKASALKEVMNRKTSNYRLSKLRERIAICIEEI